MRKRRALRDPRAHLTSALLNEFQKTGSAQSAAQLTGALTPLVYRVARRYERTGVPLPELRSVAWSGLHAVLAGLAMGRAVRLDTLARYVATGEVSRYVRRVGAGRRARTGS